LLNENTYLKVYFFLCWFIYRHSIKCASEWLYNWIYWNNFSAIHISNGTLTISKYGVCAYAFTAIGQMHFLLYNITL